MELPNKKYQIVYADPPWDYNDKRKVKDMRSVGGSSSGFGANKYYKTVPTKDICELNVSNISEENSILFLWSTSSFLPYALKVIKAWGFKYKTVGFVWAKTRSKGKFTRILGRWTMGSTEFILIGIKGKPKRMKNNVYQFIIEEHTTHSKKPNIFREKIVELMGDISRVELYATEKRKGWDCWGLEAPNTITKLDYFKHNLE